MRRESAIYPLLPHKKTTKIKLNTNLNTCTVTVWMIYSGEKLGKRWKISFCARFIHLAFFASIFTQLWHLGQWTFTGLFDLCRLASRIPMYVHSWLQWWQVTLQLEYWDSMNYRAEIETINGLQMRSESEEIKKGSASTITCSSTGNYLIWKIMLSDVKPRFDRLISSGKLVVWFPQTKK